MAKLMAAAEAEAFYAHVSLKVGLAASLVWLRTLFARLGCCCCFECVFCKKNSLGLCESRAIRPDRKPTDDDDDDAHLSRVPTHRKSDIELESIMSARLELSKWMMKPKRAKEKEIERKKSAGLELLVLEQKFALCLRRLKI